jgi:hypothetical protein
MNPKLRWPSPLHGAPVAQPPLSFAACFFPSRTLNSPCQSVARSRLQTIPFNLYAVLRSRLVGQWEECRLCVPAGGSVLYGRGGGGVTGGGGLPIA